MDIVSAVVHRRQAFQIKQIKKGDVAFIYHTGDEKQVVGIAEIISDPYIDPKANNPRLYVFDIKPKKRLKIPVTLEQVKADKRFKDSRLVNEPRLSVQPMPEELWDAVLTMSGQIKVEVFTNGRSRR